MLNGTSVSPQHQHRSNHTRVGSETPVVNGTGVPADGKQVHIVREQESCLVSLGCSSCASQDKQFLQENPILFLHPFFVLPKKPARISQTCTKNYDCCPQNMQRKGYMSRTLRQIVACINFQPSSAMTCGTTLKNHHQTHPTQKIGPNNMILALAFGLSHSVVNGNSILSKLKTNMSHRQPNTTAVKTKLPNTCNNNNSHHVRVDTNGTLLSCLFL